MTAAKSPAIGFELDHAGAAPDRRRAATPALACLAGGAVLLFLWAFDPAAVGRSVDCPFHALTGLYCPGCGSLRGLHALLHGRLGVAIRCNALMVVSLPMFVWAAVPRRVTPVWREARAVTAMPAPVIWAYLALLLAFWVVRNIPVHPFTTLVP